MSKKEEFLYFEEEFHSKDRKKYKKIRKRAQETDRSKFKKTDQKKLKVKKSWDQKELERGQILSIVGEGVLVQSEKNQYLCTLKGTLKKEKTRVKRLIAVGDFVRFSISSEKEGQIVHVEDRISFLGREDLTGRKQQIIAVNIDQVLITVSVMLPPFKPFLVDRYMIAARKGNMKPIIVINKVDLLKNKNSDTKKEKELYKNFLASYKASNIPIISVSTITKNGLKELKRIMKNKSSVFSGQSGVGKSSLINEILGLKLKTVEVTKKTLKGGHITATAKLIPIKGGGFCIDTPGIRSFGLWNLKPDDVAKHFQEIESFAHGCKFPDCTHLREPGCQVMDAVEKNEISSLRFESYSSLMEEALEEIVY